MCDEKRIMMNRKQFIVVSACNSGKIILSFFVSSKYLKKKMVIMTSIDSLFFRCYLRLANLKMEELNYVFISLFIQLVDLFTLIQWIFLSNFTSNEKTHRARERETSWKRNLNICITDSWAQYAETRFNRSIFLSSKTFDYCRQRRKYNGFFLLC